jgi:hypothetical protein
VASIFFSDQVNCSSVVERLSSNNIMGKLVSAISLFLLFLLATVHASPAPGGHHDDGRGCLSDQEANSLLYKWISLFVKIDPKVADKILTDNFQQISASLNFLEGKNA